MIMRRSFGMGASHSSHIPYVPSSIRLMASSISKELLPISIGNQEIKLPVPFVAGQIIDVPDLGLDGIVALGSGLLFDLLYQALPRLEQGFAQLFVSSSILSLFFSSIFSLR